VLGVSLGGGSKTEMCPDVWLTDYVMDKIIINDL